MTGWAARYSSNITRDIERGYSFAGWAIDPAPTEEQLRSDLVKHYGWSRLNAERIRVEYTDDLGGYLPAHDGLCAWYAEDRDDAVDMALQDSRFDGIPLYVFRAEWIKQDPEDGTDIVRPIGEPQAES